MEFIQVKRKRRTAQDWYDLVKQWLASGKSQREFCELNDIYPKTFSRWVCDYRHFFHLPDTKPVKKVTTPVVSQSLIANNQTSSHSVERVAQLCVGELCVKVPLSATESEWRVIFSSLRLSQ